MSKVEKFCCDTFKGNYQAVTDREVFPNIKIVKIENERINIGKNPYRYYFVCGFLRDKPPYINMRYCPFCGTDLFKFYKSDEYVNADYKIFEI